MKKLLILVTVGLFLLGMLACGGDKYGEAKVVIEDMANALESFTADAEKIESADDAAKILEDFAEKMKGLSEKMKSLQEKYPEIKNQKDVPEELKEGMKRLESIGPKLGGAMMKMAKYATDPKVIAAQKKFYEAMKSAK